MQVVAINFLVFESQCTVPYKNRQSSESCSFADLGVHEDWLFSLGIPLTMASVVIGELPVVYRLCRAFVFSHFKLSFLAFEGVE